MYISQIFVKNFRNFRHLDIAIGEGVTCFIGENNCGKTNLSGVSLHCYRYAWAERARTVG
jgi:predicted ATP-dependent endonuclease of OLD family